MKKFLVFYFKRFEFDKHNLIGKFYYSFDNIVNFQETINFKNDNFNLREDIDDEILNNFLFSLHIALGISYYKLFITETLEVESGKLSDQQIEFWKKFYINGLGEFLYKNNISPKNLFNFINKSDKIYSRKNFTLSNKALVPIGGGKDSILTIELLKKSGIDFDLFVFGKIDILKQNTANISGKHILFVQRKLDPELFELNKIYYNGHVPITGIIAFVMEVVAYLYNYKYLVLSNEKSANFGNVFWESINVNHQYSKSFEFEIDFKNYVEKNLSLDIKYFSLLRGLYEVKIAELFSKLGKKYFGYFSSCNNNFKIVEKGNNANELWCNKCPKCLFVYSILHPYISNQDLDKIFGKNLYNDKDLLPLYKQLLGIDGIKPFECVGESQEVIYSMNKSLSNYSKNELPYILRYFNENIILKFDEKSFKNLEKKFDTIDQEDIIPKEIKQLIFKNILDDKKSNN